MKRLLLLTVLAGCGGPPSETVRVCLERKTEIVMTPMPTASGSVTLRPMPQTRCVESEERSNPKYAEWLDAQAH